MWWCSLRSLCMASTSQRMLACTVWSSCSPTTCLLVRDRLHIFSQAHTFHILLAPPAKKIAILLPYCQTKSRFLPAQLLCLVRFAASRKQKLHEPCCSLNSYVVHQ